MHRDGKAARHLFEASVSDAIDRGGQFHGSSLDNAQMPGKKYCVCGVVLCNLLLTAFPLQAIIDASEVLMKYQSVVLLSRSPVLSSVGQKVPQTF